MTPFFAVFMSLLLGAVLAQRPPYAGSSDPGVLPIYLPLEDRLGAGDSKPPDNTPHMGTLENEEVFNRVSEWPEDRKPFWYVNREAIQKQREQEQMQQAQVAAQAQANRRPPFSSSRPSRS